MVELLLRFGANPDARDGMGKVAREYLPERLGKS